MSNNVIDLARGVPTTVEDIEVLARLRRETPSWVSLSPTQVEALVQKGPSTPGLRHDQMPGRSFFPDCGAAPESRRTVEME